MADAPDTSSYILATTADGALPNSRQLAVGKGLSLADSGPGGSTTISASLTLAAIEDLANSDVGLITKTGANSVAVRSITSNDDSVDITYPNGVSGNIDLSVASGSSVQKVNVSQNGTLVSPTSNINLIPGGGMGIFSQYNPGSGAVDVTFSNSSATFLANVILQTADSQAPNGQALDQIASGSLLKVGDDGVVEAAEAGTDFLEPNDNLDALSNIVPAQGTLIIGNGTSFSGLDIDESDEGKVLTVVDGQWQAQANSGDTSDWSEFPALQDVDMQANGFSNIDAVRFRDNGLTGGKTFEIANNSGADLSLRINRFQNGAFQDFGILYDSRYNVPPSPSTWSTYSASVSASLAGNDLLNGRWLNCSQTRLWQTLSSNTLSGNSYQLAYDATGLKLNSVDSSGTVTETGYVYDSVINPPPSSSTASVLIFQDSTFQVPTTTVTEVGNTVACTQTGYYLLNWELFITRYIDGTDFTNISFTNPSAIFYYLKESGSSPANYVAQGTISSGAVYEPVATGQIIYKYNFSGVATLFEGESYVMAVNNVGSMDWGSASLTCTAIYQAPYGG
jgi:hypothetical protein